MASRSYHGADLSLTVTTKDGVSITVGEIRGVNIVEQFEADDFYSADSIKRAKTKQRNFSVLVDFDIGKFDIALIKQFHGGSGGSATQSMQDTSDTALYDVTGTVTQHEASTDLEATVSDCRFDGELPVFSDVSHDGWMVYSGTMVGKDIRVREV